MQTNFSPAQLADPDTQDADAILRTCVHCGFCTATCPTYVLLGDELDSPRGRIYLIKDMLETERPPTAEVVKHLDRCLSCLSCMTTCPSGVNYMHLVDHARHRVAATFRRPWADRAMRRALGLVLPRPALFRPAMLGGSLAKAFARFLPKRHRRAAARSSQRRCRSSSRVDRPQVFRAEGAKRRRVALLSGCAQQVLAPGINEATIRLLTRHGCEVVVAEGAGCCGALAHHLGEDGQSFARRNMSPGQARSSAAGSTRSSSTPRAAGPCSRITASCSAATPPSRRRRRSRRARTRRYRGHGRDRTRGGGQPVQAARRLSQRLFAAARPARSRRAQGPAQVGGLRHSRSAGGPSLLRLGRHLQYPPR